MPKTIYMTGAPASGKSTTARTLAERFSDTVIWEYGARLTEYKKTKSTEIESQTDIRAMSAAVITPEDIAEVDDLLIAFVANHRQRQHIIIDSHPVTKERYGFRITPFSFSRFAQLAPNEIWVLSATPETTRRRIKEDSGGRPMISAEDARTHTVLQSSVAATYAMSLGIPCYIFDTDLERESLLLELGSRLV